LKNFLERAALLTPGPEIGVNDLALPLPDGPGQPEGHFREAKRIHLRTFEKGYLRNLLEACGGNVSEASRQAGLARRNFQLLLKKHQLNPRAFKKEK
jgi:DNA-binding NtrC family response regulator